MGVIKQGILGGFSGRVAGVVGSSWKGIPVIKSLPLSVANPNTAAQQAQRGKFSGIVALASLLLATTVKPLWDRFSSKASGYNDFVKANIDVFVGDVLTTFADLKISIGKMASTAIDPLNAAQNQTLVEFNWDDDAGEGLKLDTDLAYMVVIDENGVLLGTQSGTTTRDNLTATVMANRNLVLAETIYCYLAFKRADGTVVSQTAYLAHVVTA